VLRTPTHVTQRVSLSLSVRLQVQSTDVVYRTASRALLPLGRSLVVPAVPLAPSSFVADLSPVEQAWEAESGKRLSTPPSSDSQSPSLTYTPGTTSFLATNSPTKASPLARCWRSCADVWLMKHSPPSGSGLRCRCLHSPTSSLGSAPLRHHPPCRLELEWMVGVLCCRCMDGLAG